MSAPKIHELQSLLHLDNTDMNGVDSTKRKLAIELLVGPPDGEQTNRLAKLALVIASRGEIL